MAVRIEYNANMNPLVLKFGGASCASPDAFHRIADRIGERKEASGSVVVVVSAMGKTTDELLSLSRKIHPNPPKRELDMLLSVGERISMALLAMALDLKGIQAVSFTGSQSGILTTDQFSEAKIVEVRPKRIVEALESGAVPIVAGFQGMSRSGQITTLGRGGSDLTAVALAIALGAEAVEFYKDVPGIFDRDPKEGNAKFFDRLSFDEALRLSKQGARVLHDRSIELAAKNGIALHVRSFLEKQEGTWVGLGVERRGEVYEV